MPLLVLIVGMLALCGCTAPIPSQQDDPASGSSGATATPSPTVASTGETTPGSSRSATAMPSSPPTMTAPPGPPRFDPDAAFRVVEQLADGIGPREAASARYRQAADIVVARFRDLGYVVERQRVPVPAGVSWGVPVGAGTSQNVVATPPGFRSERPHRLIGAHLDTVPQAPGAEDNASGVAVLLELARMAVEQPPAVPVVLVAFGAEEPRGPGDAMHHFGSQAMVATMDEPQSDAMLGMVSLDRVGVRAGRVPVCHGGHGADDVREELVDAAVRAGVPVTRCENRASDHWSFEKAGVPAARLGSVPYAAYHSASDVPSVVDPAQLDRVGRIAWEWMLSPA